MVQGRSTVILLEGGKHRGHNVFGRIVSVKGSPRVGGPHKPVVFLGSQQHELALAVPSDVDRPSESRLNDITWSIAEVGQGEASHQCSSSIHEMPIFRYFPGPFVK
jgi:hypothetical protein